MYIYEARHDSLFMVEAGRDLAGITDLKFRRSRRSAVERHQIVEETFEPGRTINRRDTKDRAIRAVTPLREHLDITRGSVMDQGLVGEPSH